MISIDMDVPAPEFTRGRPKLYPFANMRVGGSFRLRNKMKVNSVRSCAAKYAKKNPGVRFTVRKYKTGYRCYRIA